MSQRIMILRNAQAGLLRPKNIIDHEALNNRWIEKIIMARLICVCLPCFQTK